MALAPSGPWAVGFDGGGNGLSLDGGVMMRMLGDDYAIGCWVLGAGCWGCYCLTASWGGSSLGGVAAFLGRETLAGLTANDAVASVGRLDAEASYGLAGVQWSGHGDACGAV